MYTIFYGIGDAFLILIGLGTIFGAPGGLIYWIITEVTVENSPAECFDVLQNCEVIRVQHQFTLFNPVCTDSFLYTWRLPNSPVLYQQLETRERTAEDCTPALDIGVQNATFALGLTNCFALQDRFTSYIGAFNCATVADKKNGTVRENSCETIFEPASSHDATVALFGASFFLLFWLYIMLVTICEG